MLNKRSFRDNQTGKKDSELYGTTVQSQLGQLSKLPKFALTDEDKALAEQARLEVEEEKKLQEAYEAEAIAYEEKKKIEPTNAVEVIAKTNLPEPEYKEYKTAVQQIEELEEKNYLKMANKNSEFFDGNGFNFFAPIYAIADSLSDIRAYNGGDFAGLTTEESTRLKALHADRRRLEQPIAQILVDEIDAQRKEISEASGDGMSRDARFLAEVGHPMGVSGAFLNWFADKDNAAEDILMKQKEKLMAFINNRDNIMHGFSDQMDWSFGIRTLRNNLVVAEAAYQQRKALEENPDDYTAGGSSDRILFANQLQQETQNLDLEANRMMYGIGAGSAHSIDFMVQNLATSGVGGTVATGLKTVGQKYVMKKLMKNVGMRNLALELAPSLTAKQATILKGLTFLEKKALPTVSKVGGYAGDVVGIGAQALVAPVSYASAAERYVGPTQLIRDSEGKAYILASEGARIAYKKEADANMSHLKFKLKELEGIDEPTPEDIKNISDIRNEMKQIESFMASIIDRDSGEILKDIDAEDAAIYGLLETAKEFGAEKFVGAGFEKLTKGLGGRISLGLEGTPVGKVFQPLNKAYKKGAEALNNTSLGKISQNVAAHTGTAKIFHSLPAEMVEEISVQLMPTYQENYMNQIKDVYDFTHDANGNEVDDFTKSRAYKFYAMTVGQTLFMGAGTTTLGAAKHGTSWTLNRKDAEGVRYQDKYKQRNIDKKEMMDLYSDIDAAIKDDTVAKHIVMSTGNSLFGLNEYRQRITDLKAEGREEDAKELENKSFINIAVKAMETDTLPQFINTLKRLNKLDPNSNTAGSLAIAKRLHETVEKYGHRYNFGEIASSVVDIELLGSDIKQAERKLQNIESSLEEEIEEFKKIKGITNSQGVMALIRQINDPYISDDVKEESAKYLKSLEEEGIINPGVIMDILNAKTTHENLLLESKRDLRRQISPEAQINSEKRALQRERNLFKKSVNNLTNLETLIEEQQIFENKLFPLSEENTKYKEEVIELFKKRREALEIKAAIAAGATTPVVNPTITSTANPNINQASVSATNVDLSLFNAVSYGDESEYVPEDSNLEPDTSGIAPPPAFSRFKVNKAVPQKAIDAATIIGKQLDAKLGREATLQDFIESRIAVHTFQQVDDYYDAFAQAWKESGRSIADIEEVWTNTFNVDNSLLESLFDIVDPSSITEVQGVTEKKEEERKKAEAKKEKFDLNGVSTKQDVEVTPPGEDRRTNRSDLKAAHKSQNSKRVSPTKWVILGRDLIEEPAIGNHYILDPSTIKEGDILEVIELDDDSQKIVEYLPDGKNITTTWGLYKEKHQIKPGDERWINKVPLAAHITHEGKKVPIFFIQDIGWYNDDNISSVDGELAKKETIAQGIANVSQIRTDVANGKNNIVITEKYFGSSDSLADHTDTTPISINEATGDSTIGVITKNKVTGQLQISTTKTKAFDGILTIDINAKDENGRVNYYEGATMDIRPVGINEDGQTIYTPFYTMNNSPIAEGALKQNLSDEIATTAKYAILASIVINNQENVELRNQIEKIYGLSLNKALEIEKKIDSDTGLKISDKLAVYMNMFVRTNHDETKTLDVISSNPNYKAGLTYFSTYFKMKDGSVGGSPQILQVMHKGSDNQEFRGQIGIGGKINSDQQSVDKTLNNLTRLFNPETGMFNKSTFNVNTSSLNKKDVKITLIGDQGVLANESKTYTDFVKDNLRTTMLSHKIKTLNGEEKWIMDVQPMVYYKSAEKQPKQELPKEEKVIVEIPKEEGKKETALERAARNVGATSSNKTVINTNFNEVVNEATKGLDAEEMEYLSSLINSMNPPTPGRANSRWKLTDEQQESISNITSTFIVGLSSRENKELVSSLKNQMISTLDLKGKISKKEIRDKLRTLVDDFLTPIKNLNLSTLEKLENQPDEIKNLVNNDGISINQLIGKLQENIDIIDNIAKQKDKLTSFSKENMGSLTKEMNSLFNTSLEEDTQEITNSEDSDIKDGNQKDIKLSYSTDLKLSLFGVPIKKDVRTEKNGVEQVTYEKVRGFLNMPKYHVADEVDKKIRSITTTIKSDWKSLIDSLDSLAKTKEQAIYTQIADKLKALPHHLQNELLHRTVSKRNEMVKVQVATMDGVQIISVLDENSSKEDLRWRNTIKKEFATSEVFGTVNDVLERELNITNAKLAQQKLQKAIASNDKSFWTVKSLFTDFGMHFNDNTIREFLKAGDPYNGRTGILSLVHTKLSSLIATAETGKQVIISEPTNNVFDNAGGALKALVFLEIMMNGSEIASSIRVAGKTMQGVIANTAMHDAVDNLKDTNSDLNKALVKNASTKNNLVLRVLAEDSNFRDSYGISFVSPEAIKVKDKENFGNTDIDKIAYQDAMTVSLGLFTNTKHVTTLLDPALKVGLNFRIGYMMAGTIADKGRAVTMKTLIMNLDKSNLSESNGTMVMSDRVLDHLVEQVFESDLNRIMEQYQTNNNTILNFGKAAKIFTTIPAFNAIEVEGKNIHAYLSDPTLTLDNAIIDKFKEEAKKVVSGYINYEVNTKISSDGLTGQFVDYDFYNPHTGTVKNVDGIFLGQKPGNNNLEKLRFLTTEYVVNNLLTLNDVHQLYLGDIAYYSKNKTIDRAVFDKDGNIDPNKISDPAVYKPLIESIGFIIDKRAALLIAPGSPLANSGSGNYDTGFSTKEFIHLAVNDVESVSGIIEQFAIAQRDGKLNKEEQELFNKLNTLNKEIETIQDEGTSTDNFEDRNVSGIKIIDTKDITNAEGKKGAAQYDSVKNEIRLNREFLKQKFAEKSWTNMRELIETIDGNRVISKAENLPENQFDTYEQFEDFVIEHEYQHSLYSRKDFNKEYPKGTKGNYETHINNRALDNIKKRDSKENASRLEELETEKSAVLSTLKRMFPELEGYFNIEGTDAQEYSTWQSHIDVLDRQGKLTKEERDLLKSAYNKLSRGQEVNSSELRVMMQPIKPVYTGIVPQGNLLVPVYIKSSSFPLLPQVTKNLKLDEVRKKLEAIEADTKKVTRLSYQTANKIGSKNSKLTMNDLYYKPLNELFNEDSKGVGDGAMTILPFENWKIQQETPSKEYKAYTEGKDAYIRMGSQFFKGILGNGITDPDTVPGHVFPNLFSEDLLRSLDITPRNGMLTGTDIDSIFKNTYYEYSDLLEETLRDEIGLKGKAFDTLNDRDKKVILTNLHKIIKKEITERNYPSYLEESIRLVDEGTSTTMPLMFDNNANKFEALLQAVISNRLIVHKLPGNSHVSASSEGFVKKKTLETLSATERNGIIWADGTVGNRELQSTTITNEDGKISIVESEVLIASHMKMKMPDGTFDYVDLSSDTYSEPILNENGESIGRKLKTDMIHKDLLTSFSFRIPTSSHQSGVILKIAGFLPREVGDIIIVPKEHTTQLGEDYDIDKRYIYKSNYYVDKAGVIQKLMYDNEVKETIDNVNNIIKEAQKLVEPSLAEDANNEEKARYNKEKVEALSTRLILSVTENDMLDDAREFIEEFESMGISTDKEGLINAGKKVINKLKLKMLENSMIDIYKTVYQSPSYEVQKKIFKPLVTDISQKTAEAMDMKLSSSDTNPYFSILSDNYQRYLLKLGADGKGGIGVHSNAVTLEAQMQRLDKDGKIRIVDYYYENDNGETIPVYFNEDMGGLETTSYLGREYRTLDGGREIADQHGENQNVSTDNINKQIMVKRNENSYTMSAFAFMAHLGYDRSLDTVHTGILDSKGNEIIDQLHVPSLFMNQPILRDYVRLREKYSSITGEFTTNVDEVILFELSEMYGFEVEVGPSGNVNLNNFVQKDLYRYESAQMTGNGLWDQMNSSKPNGDFQGAILQKFFKFSSKAKELSVAQQLINLSTSKLGISYFEVLQRTQTLDNLVITNSFENITNLIGDYLSPQGYEIMKDNNPDSVKGFTLVGNYYWKPTTPEGKMLINSLSVANETLPVFFPYGNSNIYNMINSIFYTAGKDISEKSASNLKLKYSIMNNFNSFISSNIGMFKDNVNLERDRLFKDKEGHKSLASILKTLKDSKHPIMDNSLLKDFSFNISLDNTGISTITHLADNNTSFDKRDKYESFNELLHNIEVLGEFNGEQLTGQMLAQDLAAYANLADNENGATGFKNFISVEYMNSIGVTNTYRKLFKDITKGEESILMSNFIKQYFQHNPKEAFKLNTNSAVRLGYEGNLNDISFNPGKIESFTTESQNKPRFISIKDRSISHTDNPYVLFTYNPYTDRYEKIDVLGTKGFNEYNSNNSQQKTVIPTPKIGGGGFLKVGNVMTYLNRDNRQRTQLASLPELLPASLGVEGILKKLHESAHTNADMKKIIEEIQDYIDPNVEIKYGPIEGGHFGSFSGNTITIDPNILELALALPEVGFSHSKALDVIKEVIVEEVIHSITIKEINKHIAHEDPNTGKITLKENAPAYAYKLVALFESARKEVPFLERDISTYYSKDIREFIAGMFVSEDYRARIDQRKEGFIKNFLESIKGMFNNLFYNKTGEVLDYKSEIFSNIELLLKAHKSNNKDIGISIGKDTSNESSGFLSLINKDTQNPNIDNNRLEINDDIAEDYETDSYDPFEDYDGNPEDFGGPSNSPRGLRNDTSFQKNQTVSDAGKIASEKTIRDLASRISNRIGISYKIESDRTKEYKGKIENSVAYINLAYATLDTPIHEILGHPIIRAIKNRNNANLYKKYDYSVSGWFVYGIEKDPIWVTSEKEADALINSVPIKNINTQLYENLLKELETGRGKEVLDRIKRDYTVKDINKNYSVEPLSTVNGIKYELSISPGGKYDIPTALSFTREFELSKSKIKTVHNTKEEAQKALDEYLKENSQNYSLEEQQEEAIVELLGLMTAGKLDNTKDGKIISLLKRLLKEMKAFIRDLINQKEIEIDKLPDNMTLNDLSDLLAYSNSKLILPGYEVEYTTPDNEKFKTYQEASNHISELARNVKDVDFSNITVPKGIPDNFTYIDGNGDTHTFNKINENEYEHIYSTPVKNYNRQILDKERYVNTIKQKGIYSFIEKNKEYEQSREIIEEWKKVNNIQYNPEEIYSRGQEFSSVVGAYSDFDVNLMMQNLLSHIEDNEKAGGKFAISAYTKPIDKQIGHLEGGGGKIKFKLYPQSKDILWAANTDVYSGSVWDASEKVNKDKKSELLGVSYTKYPSLQNINVVQPNLANIVDNLAHHHNELGIVLTGNNFRLEYDEDIPYTTKKIIDGINKILDQKYGKLVKPEIKKTSNTVYKFNNQLFYTLQDARKGVDEQNKIASENSNNPFIASTVSSYSDISEEKMLGIQPTQTKETLKESIEGVKNNISGNKTLIPDSSSSTGYRDEFGNDATLTEKEHTSQALINTKIAALKEIAKKYPRSLIRSEVQLTTSQFWKNEGFEDGESPFQKIPNKYPDIKDC